MPYTFGGHMILCCGTSCARGETRGGVSRARAFATEGAARDDAEMLWAESCITLMQLHADGGDGTSVTEALAAAHRLLDECGPLLTASPAASDAPVAPREITACIYQLVAMHGLQHVRAAQRTIGEPHATLNIIFHEVVQWKVRGYDR